MLSALVAGAAEHPQTQTVFAVLVLFLSAVSHLLVRPYRLKLLNRLEALSLSTLLCILVLSFLYFDKSGPFASHEFVITLVLMIGSLFFLVAVLASVLRVYRKQRRSGKDSGSGSELTTPLNRSHSSLNALSDGNGLDERKRRLLGAGPIASSRATESKNRLARDSFNQLLD